MTEVKSDANWNAVVVVNPVSNDAAVIDVGSPERSISPKESDRLNSNGNSDVILSNPSLPTDEISASKKVRLSWENLDVDAILPPPSCFTKLRNSIRGNHEKGINSRRTKPILKKVTGVTEPGSLLAIMGASGAGKTTFLNVLSRQSINHLQVSGNILVNGVNIGSKIKSISAYVRQEDLFIGTLTVKEHLTFQALLRMENTYTTEEKMKRVNDVMAKLGLLKCKDTIIGVPGRIRGISGGENKRLSFASEIITNPNLFFVDEPTSGLDSFMAESVITALKEIAKEGKTVLATIHQPSSEVFALFDRLLLMSEGRTAFLGSTADALPFFSEVGYPCPVNYNPADHYIHTLAIIPTQEEECRQKAGEICDHFDEQFGRVKTIEDANSNTEQRCIVTNNGPRYNVSYFKQLRAVLWRSSQAGIREPYVAKMRIIQAIFISLIAGLVYLRQDNDQQSIYNINGAMFFIITTMSFNSVTGSLFVFPAELPVFLKEHKLGMYRTSVYFISKTLAELPWYILSTFLFSIIVYWMSGFRNDVASFFIFCAIVQLISQSALSYGYLISCIAPTVQIATSAGPVAILPLLLFGGFFVKDGSIPPYFLPFKYISWFKYSYAALQINQWKDYEIGGCTNATKICFSNGNMVLKQNGYDPDEILVNIGGLLALMVGFRLLSMIVVIIKAARAK